MENVRVLDGDWHLLVKMLPHNWRELAKSTKAMLRRLRNFKDEESLLRSLLLHVATGYSLRETSVRLKAAKIANASDVALLKRLRSSGNWLRQLCLSLLKEQDIKTSASAGRIRMRIVDGTNIKEPGKTGSTWRIHYSLTLSDLKCDYFRLTKSSGRGTGESFKQFPVKKGDCIIGDRGYSTAQGIAYVAARGGYSLVRVNTGILHFANTDNKKFDLLSEIRNIEQEHDSREWEVNINNARVPQISGRLCVIKKNHIARNQSIKQLRRLANRRGTLMQTTTEEFAGYVIVFTTLPKELYPLESILEWYRVRWQIELVFKRLKTLAGLGHLPKQDDESSKAWLYGKLLTGLLVEKLIGFAKTVSPWGYL
jgi:hypothetical protein